MISITKNFLSFEDCNKVINFYNNNASKKFTYGATEPITIINCNDYFIQGCLQKINKQCIKIAEVCMDNAEVIKWLDGGTMAPHYDVGDEFAAIVYLNSDYKGGELVIEGIEIKPDVGEFIVFSNGKLLHSVNKVVGERYTLSTWFKVI